MPIVSIIMVAWNQLEYIKQVVFTLDQFTDRDEYKFIVVDNASDEATAKYLHEMYNDGIIDSLITNDKNLGYIVAANQGYEEAKDKYNLPYVCWVGSDILFQKDWLKKFLHTFENNRKIGAVGPISNYVAGLQKIEMNVAGLKQEETKLLIGFFIMIKDEVIQKIGPLDESFGMGGADDLDYSVRIREAGYKLYINREVFIYHYGSKSLLAAMDGSIEKYNAWCRVHDKKFMDKWGAEKFNEFFDYGERLRITVAIPMNSDLVHRKFTRSLVALRKPGTWDYIDCPRLNIDEARNKLAKWALDWKCTHVLFIDDDMVFQADAVERLLDADKDIICGLAFQRRPQFLPCIYNVVDTPSGFKSMKAVDSPENKGLMKVDACGSAFVLIKREVLEKTKFPWYTWGDKTLGVCEDTGGTGEDIGFCLKAKQAGFETWCDTDLIIKHLGDAPEIDEKTYKEYKETEKISLTYEG